MSHSKVRPGIAGWPGTESDGEVEIDMLDQLRVPSVVSLPGPSCRDVQAAERSADQAPSTAATRVRPSLLIAPRMQALLLVPMLLLIFAQPFLAPTDPDYWWHVRTGQLMAETGMLPREDVFSHTVAGRAWVTHEWLTQVLFFLVERQVGYVGNVALFGLLGALTALAVYATSRLRGLGEPAAALLMFGTWASWISLATVRPQVVTALLTALLVLLLTLYKRGHARALWPIPPLLALWVNLHGGYVIGLVLLGVTVVGETAAWILRRPATPLRPLVVVTALAALATLVSPHGLEALVYPFSYAGTGNASMRLINEWQSPNFHLASFLPFAASLLLGLWLGLGRRPLGPTELLWALLLTLMALRSARHIPLYGIVVAPLLAARLAAELPALRQSLPAWRRRSLLIVVTWVMMALSLAQLVRSPQAQEHLQLGRGPNASLYPAGAVEYLRAEGLTGNLFNEYHWGGYLIYQLHPERRVFIDGRADVYGDAFIDRYVATTQLAPGWRQTLDQHDVRVVLVSRKSPLAEMLGEDAGWREVYTGKLERLFARQ